MDKSACRLIFKMNITTAYHYRIISGSGTRPTDTEKTIIVEYGFRLTGTDATYYLDEDGSWQTERITISEGVKTSEGSERTIEMAGFPASGQLQFFIVQCLSGYSAARNSQWQSANFSQMSITLDAEEDFESDPSYGLAVIAANNIDQENFFGGTAEEMHVDNQLVAKSLAPNASFKHAFGANFSNIATQHSVNQVILKTACPRKIISSRTVRICLPSAKMVRIRYCPSRILNVLARIDAAAMEALSMFVASISCGVAEPTCQSTASAMVISLNLSLVFGESCFESLRSGWKRSGGSITAAA